MDLTKISLGRALSIVVISSPIFFVIAGLLSHYYAIFTTLDDFKLSLVILSVAVITVIFFVVIYCITIIGFSFSESGKFGEPFSVSEIEEFKKPRGDV